MDKCIPFEKSFASHSKSIYWSKINTKKPDQVSKSSHTKYWFRCGKCDHFFESALNKITNLNRWCPYCCNQKLCVNKSCQTCFNKSFASSTYVKYWSEDNKISPRQVFLNTAKKYYFNCKTCDHKIQKQLCSIPYDKKWCSYCESNKLCKNENCNSCFNKSFASHNKAKFWNKQNNISPRHIHRGSRNMYLFDCEVCGHCFKKDIKTISHGGWCPYCGNFKLCDNDKCKFCFNKSFASSDKAKFWSNKNPTLPRNVHKHSDKIFRFRCSKGHIFKAKLNSITSKNGSWCPSCLHKTEHIMHNFLKENFENVKWQFKAEWCKNKTYLPFDFLLTDHNIIIELDGIQHFKQVAKWKSPQEIQKKDIYKMNCANKYGYSVIRILQQDVYYNKYDWKKKLLENIEKLIKVGVANIFICNNNEYDPYQKKIEGK